MMSSYNLFKKYTIHNMSKIKKTQRQKVYKLEHKF